MNREAFIARIVTRLGRTPQASAPERDVKGAPEFYKKSPYGQDVITDEVDRVARFQLELEALGGRVMVVDSNEAVTESLRQVLLELAPNTIITWDRLEFIGWRIDWLWDESHAVSWYCDQDDIDDNPNVVDDLRAKARLADVGITLADCAIANTGTLLVCSSPKRARSVSLLPSVHIALVRESQIVDRVGEAMKKFPRWTSADIPSSLHFISGPSRSADIENDLSIGVHGPAAVVVIVLREKSAV